MAEWKLRFVLLLPLTACFNSKETFVKIIGSKSDLTPVCTNGTEHIITLMVCRIRTERHWGDNCSLLYQYGHDFVHECDSRFTLMMENHTLFLHLTGLTPEDSGNYTCQCSNPDGTKILHLNLTVEEDENSTVTQIPGVLIGVTAVIVSSAVILGFICVGLGHGGCSRSTTSGLTDEDDPDDPYMSLQQPASDLYQTLSKPANNSAGDPSQIQNV